MACGICVKSIKIYLFNTNAKYVIISDKLDVCTVCTYLLNVSLATTAIYS